MLYFKASLEGSQANQAPLPGLSEGLKGALNRRDWCRRYPRARDDKTLANNGARDDRDVLMRLVTSVTTICRVTMKT